MKDEIKEINIPENVLVALGDLTNGALNYYKATETVKVRHNTILDYITNLQEEKDMYKCSFEEMSKNYFEEQSRIDKAIDNLLNILTGGDEE